MAYDYKKIKYLDDVNEKWVKNFLEVNIPTIYKNLDDQTRNAILQEFNNLKEDAKLCYGDKVWLGDKLEYFKEKMYEIQGKEWIFEREKLNVLGMVMLKKLSAMEWSKPVSVKDLPLQGYGSDLEQAVDEAINEFDFTFTESEEDLLNKNNSGGTRKKRRKFRRRKHTRKRRKKKTKKRRKSRRRKRRKKRRRKKRTRRRHRRR